VVKWNRRGRNRKKSVKKWQQKAPLKKLISEGKLEEILLINLRWWGNEAI